MVHQKQFGDFFHDMVLHVTLSAVTATNAAYYTTPALNPANGSELLAYCDWVGQRLVKKVNMTVNGNPLDEYDSDVQCMHQKFLVGPHKAVAWARNVGQEVPKPAFIWAQQGASAATGRGAGVREQTTVCDGPQTPKSTQPALDLWVPLLFWFNVDPRLSIPSVSIPYGQRFINVTLAAASEVLQHLHATDPAMDAPGSFPVPTPDVTTCELWINNIFVNPEIHDIFIKRIGFNLIRVHRRQVIRVNKQQDDLLLNQLKWPVETIYVGFRPTDNIDANSSQMLTAWHQYCQVTDVTADASALSASYSWDAALAAIVAPTEGDLFTNFISTFPGQANPFTALGPALLTYQQINAKLVAVGLPPLTINTAVAPSGALIIAATPTPYAKLRYQNTAQTVQKISVEAHGVPLYRDLPTVFFNQYVPYTYGGPHINAPVDIGVMMITFNLYPGSYQPSGHVNVSRAREFYLKYTSTYIGSGTPADMVMVGICINFLLISDGSAVLRYST